MTSSRGPFDPNKLIGKWYGVEHNIHSLEDKCSNGIDEFSIVGNTLLINKICTDKRGMSSVSSGSTTISSIRGNTMKFLFRAERGLDTTITYVVYDTDYTTYMIVGNGDRKTFRIMSRKSRVELCWLSGIEIEASKMGFDVSHII